MRACLSLQPSLLTSITSSISPHRRVQGLRSPRGRAAGPAVPPEPHGRAGDAEHTAHTNRPSGSSPPNTPIARIPSTKPPPLPHQSSITTKRPKRDEPAARSGRSRPHSARSRRRRAGTAAPKTNSRSGRSSRLPRGLRAVPRRLQPAPEAAAQRQACSGRSPLSGRPARPPAARSAARGRGVSRAPGPLRAARPGRAAPHLTSRGRPPSRRTAASAASPAPQSPPRHAPPLGGPPGAGPWAARRGGPRPRLGGRARPTKKALFAPETSVCEQKAAGESRPRARRAAQIPHAHSGLWNAALGTAQRLSRPSGTAAISPGAGLRPAPRARRKRFTPLSGGSAQLPLVPAPNREPRRLAVTLAQGSAHVLGGIQR